MKRARPDPAAVGEAWRFSVPLVPPSVNHYKMRSKHGHWYVSAEAIAFKEAVALFARQYAMPAAHYELEATIYLGKGQRGDGDNFWKCIADGLVECGAILSDARITDWIMHKRRDPANPRTEIIIRGKAHVCGRVGRARSSQSASAGQSSS